MKKVMYAITVLYQDYKNVDATPISVHPDMERAKKGILDEIEERFSHIKEDSFGDEDEAGWRQWIQEKFLKYNKNEVLWEYDDGDSVTKIYIDKVEVDFGVETPEKSIRKEDCHFEDDKTGNVTVYQKDEVGSLHLAGHIMNATTGYIEDLTDEEFDEMLRQNGIF